MLNSEQIVGVKTALNAYFAEGFKAYAERLLQQPGVHHWNVVAHLIKSMTDTEQHGWVKNIPGVREWVGPRVIQSFMAADYKLSNRPFEGTVGIDANALADNKLYTYAEPTKMLGASAAEYPYRRVWELLLAGFVQKCYNGQPYFSTAHPLDDGTTQSNLITSGGGAYWFLLDLSQLMLPFIYQLRKDPEIVTKAAATDDNMFFDGQVLFGVDFRCQFGFTLPQLAVASNKALNATNFEEAFNQLASLKHDDGRKFGARATVLVHPTTMRGAAMTLVKEKLAGGEDNVWHKAVDLKECKFI